MKTSRMIKTFTLLLFATLLSLFVLTGGDLSVIANANPEQTPVDTPPRQVVDTIHQITYINPIDTMDSISQSKFLLMSTSKSVMPIRIKGDSFPKVKIKR